MLNFTKMRLNSFDLIWSIQIHKMNTTTSAQDQLFFAVQAVYLYTRFSAK